VERTVRREVIVNIKPVIVGKIIFLGELDPLLCPFRRIWSMMHADAVAKALTSRYGDPKDLLTEDWIPEIPGINAKGRYEDYTKDPWKTVSAMFKKIEDGSYEYFYPAVKGKKGHRGIRRDRCEVSGQELLVRPAED
jgi:hypothetical protein